ncbi:MAG: radical SAM protein [Thermoguttaceae bacterium]
MPMPSDQDIFILNPFFRIRKEKDHVIVYGPDGLGTWPFHLSYGVVIALFNGERTVADIARITRSFVDLETDSEAIAVASQHVKAFARLMTKTRQEQTGEEAGPPLFPSDAPLLQRKEYDEKFGSMKIPRLQYNPRDFLPKDISEVSGGPYSTVHYRSPHNISWHVTSECSVNCKYCYLRRRDVRPLSKTRALSLVKEMADADVFCATLLGGDVLLYPYLLDVLEEMCRFKLIPIGLSTKSFLSKEMAKALAQLSEMITELQFSIDTDDEQIAKYLVSVSRYPDRVFSSIDNALEAGLNVAAKAVITPYNVLTVPRLYRALRKRGVSKIRLAAYCRSGYYHTDDLFLNDKCFAWLEEEVKGLQDEFSDRAIHVQNGSPQTEPLPRETRKGRWKKRLGCAAGKSSMMICTDGKVIPCEQMPETDEYFCGDVSHQSLLEVWNGNRLKEMTYGMPREKLQGQPCYDCEERENCLNVMGNCIRDLAAHYGNIYQPPPNCFRHDLAFIRMT